MNPNAKTLQEWFDDFWKDCHEDFGPENIRFLKAGFAAGALAGGVLTAKGIDFSDDLTTFVQPPE